MSVFKTRGKHAESLGKDGSPPAPKIAPACKACSPLDFGPCTCTRDCKHLSCTASWRETPSRSETPGCPVTREAVQADREARQELTAQADQPTTIIPALQSPPADLTAPWRPPVPAGESQDRLARVMYPLTPGTPEQYAAVMCQVSAATGTASRWETPASWPRHAIEAAEEIVA